MTFKGIRYIALSAAALTLPLLSGCGGKEEEAVPAETELINEIRKTDRLYVAEYVIHKLVTANDIKTIKVNWLADITIPASIGNRKIAIPVEAVLKAYVDFDSLTADDIKISEQPRTLTLTMRQPSVELTSSKIHHKDIKEYTSFTRMRFSDEEISNLEKQGRKVILASIPDMGIEKRARQNAKDLLRPMLMSLGFEKVEIRFKEEAE